MRINLLSYLLVLRAVGFGMGNRYRSGFDERFIFSKTRRHGHQTAKPPSDPGPHPSLYVTRKAFIVKLVS